MYCGGMTIAIFGLFNVITAMFVEATMNGLKHNDVQRRHNKLYERRYVRARLQSPVDRVRAIKGVAAPVGKQAEASSPRSQSSRMSRSNSNVWTFWRTQEPEDLFDDDGMGGILPTLSETEFYQVMQDPQVFSILESLDIDPMG